jgi:hypothetical protein
MLAGHAKLARNLGDVVPGRDQGAPEQLLFGT